jgi:hypothetical protein
MSTPTTPSVPEPRRRRKAAGPQIPWLVMDASRQDIFCQHCGESHPLAGIYPIKLSTFSALLDGLGRQHADCPCPPGGPLKRTPPVLSKDGTPEERAIRWLRESFDCGISSKTMLRCLDRCAFLRAGLDFDLDHAGVPQDPDDFGRCSRLLALIPEFRPRLAEVAVALPQWSALVEVWDELEALYKEEAPTGKAARLYLRIQELVEEGQRRAGWLGREGRLP